MPGIGQCYGHTCLPYRSAEQGLAIRSDLYSRVLGTQLPTELGDFDTAKVATSVASLSNALAQAVSFIRDDLLRSAC